MPKAIVRFVPRNRPGASGVTDDDGRYRLSTKASFDGAFAGGHTVTVVPWLLGVGDAPTDPRLTAPPEDRKDIPEQYRVSYTTPLKADVVAGRENTADFELSP